MIMGWKGKYWSEMSFEEKVVSCEEIRSYIRYLKVEIHDINFSNKHICNVSSVYMHGAIERRLEEISNLEEVIRFLDNISPDDKAEQKDIIYMKGGSTITIK